MDQNQMKLIAHFKVLFTKETGIKMDLMRFTSDKAYAKGVLERASSSENEELLVVTMQLMKLHGFLKQTEEPEAAKDKIDQKYVGRLR